MSQSIGEASVAGEFELLCDGVGRAEWHDLLATGRRCALQQDWAYGVAVAASGQGVRRFVGVHRGQPVALAQVVERQLFGRFRLALLMRGPIWLGTARAPSLEPLMLSAIRSRLGAGVLLWSPEIAPRGNRLHGLRRVMTGHSTIWLDLARDLGSLYRCLDGKWRNALRRAEAAGTGVEPCRDGPLVDWLVEANERYRRLVGYRGPTPPFVRQLAEAFGERGCAATTLVATHGGEPVAGVMLHQHGTSATYFLGCTSPRGRELNAHHLLLWRAIGMLKERGVRSLDLGGVDTVTAPGLARFKLGLGGEVTTLAGTFLAPPLSRDR